MNFEPEMIVIPEGQFLMGCETGAANERPVLETSPPSWHATGRA